MVVKRRNLVVGAAVAGALSGGRGRAWALPGAPEDAPLTLPQMPLHDPWIVADAASQTYWLFTSLDAAVSGEPGVGVMAYRSRDLRHWTPPTVVFRLPPGGWADAGGWAPEVHRWRGRWVMFVTVHNERARLPVDGSGSGRPVHRRGTVLAAADGLAGPFTLLHGGEPVVPKDRMTLDGTLHIDRAGRPWMVFAHEWVQLRVGTMSAVPLDDALRAIGPPRVLFRGDASPHALPQQGIGAIVTDGPQLYRSGDGSLHMLWSSWGSDGYFQTVAHSPSGELFGPWTQGPKWLGRGSGHGMLFRRFDGGWMLVLHRPFKAARGKLYEVRDAGHGFELLHQRVDLDLDPEPLPPLPPSPA